MAFKREYAEAFVADAVLCSMKTGVVALLTCKLYAGEVVPIPTFWLVSTVIAVVPADWMVSAVAEGLVIVGTVNAVPLNVRFADPAKEPELLY